MSELWPPEVKKVVDEVISSAARSLGLEVVCHDEEVSIKEALESTQTRLEEAVKSGRIQGFNNLRYDSVDKSVRVDILVVPPLSLTHINVTVSSSGVEEENQHLELPGSVSTDATPGPGC